jgi:glycine/serine hydroxymethyltransferase
MGTAEMKQIGDLIHQAIQSRADNARLASLREEVKALSSRFPLYRHRLVGE